VLYLDDCQLTGHGTIGTTKVRLNRSCHRQRGGNNIIIFRFARKLFDLRFRSAGDGTIAVRTPGPAGVDEALLHSGASRWATSHRPL
jgi:hypothetical protein